MSRLGLALGLRACEDAQVEEETVVPDLPRREEGHRDAAGLCGVSGADERCALDQPPVARAVHLEEDRGAAEGEHVRVLRDHEVHMAGAREVGELGVGLVRRDVEADALLT